MGRPRLYADNAARVAANREKNNMKSFSCDLPADLIEQLNQWLADKKRTKRDVLEKLIRTQLLRKR
jgi:metal-responsive CopG/Arc/MetJ family transcriptional regulator